jgi:hypothetical protein
MLDEGRRAGSMSDAPASTSDAQASMSDAPVSTRDAPRVCVLQPIFG